MMQDWADRLDLLEQDKVEQASLRLTFSPGGVQALSPRAEAEVPSIVVPQPVQASFHPQPVNASTQSCAFAPHPAFTRLPAVRLPTDTLNAELSEEQRIWLERLKIFNSPRCLPADAFAKAVGKARRSINHDIQMGKLLALTMGNRGVRVPDWHLDPVKHLLIKAVLKYAQGIDPWMIYEALCEPHPVLNKQAPIDAATRANVRSGYGRVLHAARGRSLPGDDRLTSQNDHV